MIMSPPFRSMQQLFKENSLTERIVRTTFSNTKRPISKIAIIEFRRYFLRDRIRICIEKCRGFGQ